MQIPLTTTPEPDTEVLEPLTYKWTELDYTVSKAIKQWQEQNPDTPEPQTSTSTQATPPESSHT